MKRYPVIILRTTPVRGYWDGGKDPQPENLLGGLKDTFVFSPDYPRTRFHKKQWLKWGSWEANFFFSAKSGLNWGQAIAAAKKRLATMMRKGNLKFTMEAEWEEAR